MTRAQEILETISTKNIVGGLDGNIVIESAPTISPEKLATYLAELEERLPAKINPTRKKTLEAALETQP